MTKKCSFCSESKIRSIIDLGKQPLVNSYLKNKKKLSQKESKFVTRNVHKM